MTAVTVTIACEGLPHGAGRRAPTEGHGRTDLLTSVRHHTLNRLVMDIDDAL